MKITYNENPLCTTVELDESEKKELWYKIKIEYLEDRLWDVHYFLKNDKHEEAKELVNPEKYFTDEESSVDKQVNETMKWVLEELQSYHCGDCTCVPCSCGKCYAEGKLDIHTTKGLGKHEAHYIVGAFKDDRNLNEAIEYLENYSFDIIPESWKKYVDAYKESIPRWSKEKKNALEWLKEYKKQHFKKA